MVVTAPPKLRTRHLPIHQEHYSLGIEHYTMKSRPVCRLAVGSRLYTLFVERDQHCHQAYNGQYNNEHFLLCKLSVNYSFSVPLHKNSRQFKLSATHFLSHQFNSIFPSLEFISQTQLHKVSPSLIKNVSPHVRLLLLEECSVFIIGIYLLRVHADNAFN